MLLPAPPLPPLLVNAAAAVPTALCARPKTPQVAAVLQVALLLAAVGSSRAAIVEKLPYLPACASSSLSDFRENFDNRGVAFNLSNAGKYVYDVSSERWSSGGWPALQRLAAAVARAQADRKA